MTATFRLLPGELDDETFLTKFRAMFRDREVEIVVHDVESEEDYPFNNPAQVKFLEESLKSSENSEEVITFESIEKLRQYVG